VSARQFLGQVFDNARQEYRSWLAAWSWTLGCFLLAATITNFLHGTIHLQLLPVFADSFDGVRSFFHLLLDLGLYRSGLWLIERAWYGTELALSQIFAVVPHTPKLIIPLWAKDAAIISTILLRAQTRAMSLSTPLSTHAMTKAEQVEWQTAIHSAPLPYRVAIRGLWLLVLAPYSFVVALTYPIRKLFGARVAGVLELLLGGALMLGFAYLAFWMLVSIVASFAASVAFIVWNGYALQTA